MVKSFTMSARSHQSIHVADLEMRVDKLHALLLTFDIHPIPFEELEPRRGINSKTVKVVLTNFNRCRVGMLTLIHVC